MLDLEDFLQRALHLLHIVAGGEDWLGEDSLEQFELGRTKVVPGKRECDTVPSSRNTPRPPCRGVFIGL
jgi:hypothetical protein